MPKMKRLHQVTIDEWLASQEDLFPDAPAPAPAPAAARSRGPERVNTSAIVFPGAIDAVGAAAAAPSVELRAIPARRRVR